MWMTGRPWLGWNTLPLLALPVVIGLGIAIALYRLFDIKIVIQRTLIWGTLTSMVIAVYIVVVGMLGILFQSQGNPVFSLIGTGLAATLFHPLQVRLHQAVSKLLYGERDAPYAVVMRLTEKLEAALAPQEALDTIVQTITEALRLSYAAIQLCQDGAYITVAAYGSQDSVPASEWVTFPLTYDANPVGRLVVAPRTSGEDLTQGDHALITGLVHEAQVTIQTAQLTADLQRSREKLVAAREEERRRLRRDLHDGLGPTLASLTLQTDAARNLLKSEPARADALLVDLKSQIQQTIADVRKLVYALRPPALDELGLVAALQEKARQLEQSSAVVITITADALPVLSAATEGAIYHIAAEAMTNVARHANARTCCVYLTLDDQLRLEVHDNGQGFPVDYRPGVGIQSMNERAAELGGTCVVEHGPEGGTHVVAAIPARSIVSPDVDKKGD
jgi:signal transduction histidine kinase